MRHVKKVRVEKVRVDSIKGTEGKAIKIKEKLDHTNASIAQNYYLQSKI